MWVRSASQNPKVTRDSIPRFATDKTTAVTVIDSTSAQTSMKVAYVLSEAPYDTGIAVSNMTKDEAGAVHFAFFSNGQELKYSTPDMVGPRSTMRILLSELLTAAEHTGSFSGYMTITADFTDAEAGVFISDFAGFTSAVAVTPKTRDPLGSGSDPCREGAMRPFPVVFLPDAGAVEQ